MESMAGHSVAVTNASDAAPATSEKISTCGTVFRANTTATWLTAMPKPSGRTIVASITIKASLTSNCTTPGNAIAFSAIRQIKGVRNTEGSEKRAVNPAAKARCACAMRAKTGTTGANGARDRKSTRLNSSHRCISYAVFCLKKKKHAEDYMPSAHGDVC